MSDRSNPSGAEVEREAVVAWMREEALRCGRNANAFVDRQAKVREIERARFLVMTASCIERGAHLRTQGANNVHD